MSRISGYLCAIYLWSYFYQFQISMTEPKSPGYQDSNENAAEGPGNSALVSRVSFVSGISANEVARHYNAVPEVGLEKRTESRIFYLRNFNNWIKSMLISESLEKIKQGHQRNLPITVLDMCCGKGGDLLKWKKHGISRLVCSDIADVSLEQCKMRYNEMIVRNNRERNSQEMFDCEFINADLSKVRLRDLYSNPNMTFDMCSCQFSLHYSFVTQDQAKCMIKNACENLKTGGYFIGTIPNADQLVHLARQYPDFCIKNEVCTVKFEGDLSKDVPLFGAAYNFTLDQVVNLPEYLIYFPLLVELLKEFGMEFVSVRTFPEIFNEKAVGDGRELLHRMQALEPYSLASGSDLSSNNPEQYRHVVHKIGELKNRTDPRSTRPLCLGTLSKAEWEVACMYLAFVFKKTSP